MTEYSVPLVKTFNKVAIIKGSSMGFAPKNFDRLDFCIANKTKKIDVIIIAGVHGDEEAGIEVVDRIINNKVNCPVKKNGKNVLLIPKANKKAVSKKTRCTNGNSNRNNNSFTNLNRCFETDIQENHNKDIKWTISVALTIRSLIDHYNPTVVLDLHESPVPKCATVKTPSGEVTHKKDVTSGNSIIHSKHTGGSKSALYAVKKMNKLGIAPHFCVAQTVTTGTLGTAMLGKPYFTIETLSKENGAYIDKGIRVNRQLLLIEFLIEAVYRDIHDKDIVPNKETSCYNCNSLCKVALNAKQHIEQRESYKKPNDRICETEMADSGCWCC